MRHVRVLSETLRLSHAFWIRTDLMITLASIHCEVVEAKSSKATASAVVLQPKVNLIPQMQQCISDMKAKQVPGSLCQQHPFRHLLWIYTLLPSASLPAPKP